MTSGNIKDKPLPQIWRDSQIFANLRGAAALEGKCGCCEYAKVCMGCRARAYSETGDYMAEEPNCSFVKCPGDGSRETGNGDEVVCSGEASRRPELAFASISCPRPAPHPPVLPLRSC